jgi:hypothetical protein
VGQLVFERFLDEQRKRLGFKLQLVFERRRLATLVKRISLRASARSVFTGCRGPSAIPGGHICSRMRPGRDNRGRSVR